MGKNDKQIATWGDLESLGYRLPYGVKGVKAYQTKGVTYADLSYTKQGYLPAYKTEFEALSADQKRGYITHNAALDTTHHDTEDTSAPITLGEDIRPLNNESTTFTHELKYLQSLGNPIDILWFSFPQKGDFGKLVFKFPTNPLYATVKMASNISSCDFGLRLYLKYGDTLANATTLTTTEVAYKDSALTGWYPKQENTTIAIDWPSTIDLSNFSGLKPGQTFFVVLRLNYYLITWDTDSLVQLKYGFIKTTFHCGEGDGAKVHTYDASLCVPWNYIPASSPQSSDMSKPASVELRCVVYNSKGVISYARYLDFEYHYTVDGSTWKSLSLGSLNVGGSDDKLNGGTSGTGYINLRLQPKVSGTVQSDYLAILLSGAKIDSDFNYKTERDGIVKETYWQGLVNGGQSARLKFDKESYAQTLNTLTTAYFQIEYD